MATTTRTTRKASTKSTTPEMSQEEALALLMASPLGTALGTLLGNVVQEPKADAKAKTTTTAKVDPVEALLKAKNLGYANGGRVYYSDAIIEAVARVTKSGKPEVVTTTESARVAGLLIAKDDKGRVYSQNVRTL